MSGPLDGLDWSPLELSGNPVPGDPGGVRRLSGQLTSLANNVGLQNRLLRSVGNNSESVWEGPAADKFHPAIKDLPGSLDKLVSSYQTTSGALEEYWPLLHSAQQMALEALHEARQAQADIRTAQGNVSNAQNAYNAAGRTYNLAVAAQRPVPGTPPPSPSASAKAQAATTNAQNAYTQSQTTLTNAQASLTSANGRLSSAKAKAATARSNGSRAATTLATKINSAAKAAPAKPHHSFWGSLWNDVTSTVSGGVQWVEHHAETIETIALGPAGLLLTPEGRQWVEHIGHAVETGLKKALPALNVASEVLGFVSLGLAVVGFIPGVGEVADAVNEGVTVLKTGVDGARLAAGEKSAAGDLAGDGLALLTAGESRVLTGAENVVKDGEEAASVASDAEKISNLKSSVNSKASELIETESNNARGPVLGGVVDTKTGEVFMSKNLDEVPEDLEPELAERLNNFEGEGADFKGTPGAHGEVVAANQALKARPGATLSELRTYSVRLKGALKGDQIPQCPNCRQLLHDAGATDV